MLEIIVVAGIVAIAAFMTGISFLRSVKGKNNGCICKGNCPGCVCCDYIKNKDQGKGK